MRFMRLKVFNSLHRVPAPFVLKEVGYFCILNNAIKIAPKLPPKTVPTAKPIQNISASRFIIAAKEVKYS